MPQEIHPDLVGLRSRYFPVLNRREYLNGQKIQKVLGQVNGCMAPWLTSTIFNGNDLVVAGATKCTTKVQLRAADTDSRIRILEGMNVSVRTCEQDTTPPLKGIVKKLQYKPRGPDTAQSEQTSMRRRHQQELTDLETNWTKDFKELSKNVKCGKKGVLEQEHRTKIRSDKLASKRDLSLDGASDSQAPGASDSQMMDTSCGEPVVVVMDSADDLLDDGPAEHQKLAKDLQAGRQWPPHVQVCLGL